MPSRTIRFTGFSVDSRKVSTSALKTKVDPNWARLSCRVPTNGNKLDSVIEWLQENCTGQWVHYKYHDSRNYAEYIVVIRFQERNDALMFKLQDAHRAWEHEDPV